LLRSDPCRALGNHAAVLACARTGCPSDQAIASPSSARPASLGPSSPGSAAGLGPGGVAKQSLRLAGLASLVPFLVATERWRRRRDPWKSPLRTEVRLWSNVQAGSSEGGGGPPLVLRLWRPRQGPP